MKDFFISYTSEDRAWAEWVAWVLEGQGYSVFLQAWDILPGSNFVHQMRLASKECERTIAILSPAYLASVYAEAEWNAAFSEDPTGEKRKLIPVRIQECEIRGLDRPIVHVDLLGLTESGASEALLRGVRFERQKPSTKPRYPPAADRPAEPPFPGARNHVQVPPAPQIGIVSTEFVDLNGQKDLTYEANELQRELGLGGAVVHLLDPTELALGIRDGRAAAGYLVPSAGQRHDINWEFFDALDLLLVRRTRDADLTVTETIYDLIRFLCVTHPRLLILDPPESFDRPLSKVPSLLIRARQGLPQGDRLLVSRAATSRTSLPFAYPLVAKPSIGWRGEGVEECRKPADLADYLRRADADPPLGRYGVLLEAKLDILDEYRVIVIGGEPVGCARKLPVPNRIARNDAVGGRWERATDIKAMALAAEVALAHKYAFAGVDVARLQSGHVVIECNRNPQFRAFDRATGNAVARLMTQYALDRVKAHKAAG